MRDERAEIRSRRAEDGGRRAEDGIIGRLAKDDLDDWMDDKALRAISSFTV